MNTILTNILTNVIKQLQRGERLTDDIMCGIINASMARHNYNKPQQLYKRIAMVAEDYTGISEADWKRSNTEVCVDARYTVIGLACEYYTDGELSALSGLTKSCINKIRNTLRHKLRRYSFRNTFDTIKAEISKSNTNQ